MHAGPDQPLGFPTPPPLTELPHTDVLLGAIHLHGKFHPHDTDGAHWDRHTSVTSQR